MKKTILHLAALSALVFAQPLSAQYLLNVREADIRAFVQDAARVTGKTFIVDARVQGKVSVVTDRPLSRSEYFELCVQMDWSPSRSEMAVSGFN
jgi:general secretion pathway protein D